MAEAQIAKVSIKHDAIMDYLMTNPTQPMSEVAAYFKVSACWLSTIIHSDVFQMQLETKKDKMFGSTVLPLREKLLGVAHVGVEKLGEALNNASTISDKQFIADTTDSVLKNLGFSPKSVAPNSNLTQNNTFISTNAETLEAAREKMRIAATPVVVDGEGVLIESSESPPTEEL